MAGGEWEPDSGRITRPARWWISATRLVGGGRRKPVYRANLQVRPVVLPRGLPQAVLPDLHCWLLRQRCLDSLVIFEQML